MNEIKNQEIIIIQDFSCFGGKHCQTTALKNILEYRGLHLSEEMLLGLGGGTGFIYWYTKQMSSPFIGCRNGKVDEFTLNVCKRIGIDADIIQTNSEKKAYDELKKLLKKGEPVNLFVDMIYLPYFALPKDAHFGGHAIVVYGIDEINNKVYISDRSRKPLNVTIEDLRKARSSKYAPFTPKNKMLKIKKYPSKISNLDKAIKESIKSSCQNMLNPPIRNIGLSGMKKWADVISKWPEQSKGTSFFNCLYNTFIYIEIGGTGGSAFRPMYAKFLEEADSIINKPELNEIATIFQKSGRLWNEIATAALPDSWLVLKRIRELSINKNQICEENGLSGLEKMGKINVELGDLMKKAVDELQERDATSLLEGIKQKIIECCQIEERAFRRLNEVVK